jgi:hypothetical protein
LSNHDTAVGDRAGDRRRHDRLGIHLLPVQLAFKGVDLLIASAENAKAIARRGEGGRGAAQTGPRVGELDLALQPIPERATFCFVGPP